MEELKNLPDDNVIVSKIKAEKIQTLLLDINKAINNYSSLSVSEQQKILENEAQNKVLPPL